ncbi:hypothetical protein Taro_050337, partial [Colocasia esculenta]|nr:hypothetical protein [Colocasia esculenta]
LLGLVVTRERSSLVPRTGLQASLGVANVRHWTGEGQADYMARLTEDAREMLAEEEGEAADRHLRRFLILVIGKLILGTRGVPVSCRCLPLLKDLSSIGSYAWGAALLSHLFDSLGISSRETGVAEFFPLIQDAGYRGDPVLCPFYSAGSSARTSNHYGYRLSGLPMSGRMMPPSHGWSRAVLTSSPWERPGRSFRGIQQVTDWTVRVREQHEDWEQRGREVASKATSDEDYFRDYARRDDLQAIVTQLREELDRAQQMVGGASFSREDPGRSVLEGQLAAAVARAEDALAQV